MLSFSDLLRLDAASEAARDAIRILTSSVLALADTAEDVTLSATRDAARRFGLPTREDVDRLAVAVDALQSAVATLSNRQLPKRQPPASGL